MEAQSPRPLVPAHVPRNHPVVTREYSLFTPAIEAMVNRVAGWIDDQVDGATIFGPSRFGKSSAVNHWLQSLLADRYGGHVPMIVWSHSGTGATSPGQFHSHLLHASRHPLARAARSPLDREEMLVERLGLLAAQGGGRFVVLVIDEAQSMSQREWMWLVALHSRLDQERIRLCVFSVASVQVFDEPIGMAMTGGAHVAARFMLSSERFQGIQDVEALRYVLSGYDEDSEWPLKSGQSFTQGLAPKAWAEGFRMTSLAGGLHQAMVEALPDRYDGPIEFPMRTVAMSARHALLRIAGGADPSDLMSTAALRTIVEGTGHTMLMAVVTAITPRLRKSVGRS
jgi:AAA domain